MLDPRGISLGFQMGVQFLINNSSINLEVDMETSSD
jgi:hypothetical protein